MARPVDIADEALTWVGAPYQHQGRDRSGVDCVGLLIAIAHKLGLSDFDIDGYSKNPSGHMMRRLLREHLTPVEFVRAQPGDVLHIKFDAQPQHIAIITHRQPDLMVHADALVGRVVEHLITADWKSKVRGVYRVVQ